MISSDIRRQIDGGETPGTAFVANPSDTNAIAAAVCAFLNTKGGVVFVGVSDDGQVHGVGEDPDVVRRRLEVRLQRDIAPKAFFTLSIDAVDDIPIISIEAPEGRDVPYVIDGRVFVRRGKRTAPTSSEELRQMVQGRSTEADRWERRPSPGFETDDLDRAEIKATYDEAHELGRLSFLPGDDIYPILRSLSLVASGGYTNACNVLFGRRPAKILPQCRVRFVRFESSKTGSLYLEDHWFDGPLVQTAKLLLDRIAAHVKVQAYFAPGESARRERFNYSFEALREGIVNALAHRDYAGFSGGMSVSIYPDRIEIWNSGRLPTGISVGDLKRPHPSIPTNPDIAHVLYLRRLMERIGRGTQKIVAACDMLGAKPPKWQDSAAGVTLTIHSAGNAIGVSLRPRQAQALGRLRPGDVVRLREYMSDQKVSERQARRDLNELEDGGFIVRSGQGRATVFQRTDRPV